MALPRDKVNKEELDERLAKHKLWLESGRRDGARFVSGLNEDLGGVQLLKADLRQAVLASANLSAATLTESNLSGADLHGAILSGARLAGANLSGADMFQANLSGASLAGANLIGAKLIEANLSGAELVKANLTHAVLQGASLIGAELHFAVLHDADFESASVRRAAGLYGPGRAVTLGTVLNAEYAVYGHPRDFAHWALLRFIGTLHLFSASYLVFIAITLYATGVRWLNGHVAHWHQWAGEHADGPVKEFAALVARIPTLPVQRHFGVLLLAIGLLALATTLHALFCPEAIKEATETRWTRELNQPLIEYRSAMYHRVWVRYLTLVSFGLGGAYTLLYLLWRAWWALWYLLHP